MGNLERTGAAKPVPEVTFRRGTINDSRAAGSIFEAALLDLSERLNVTAITGAQDAEARARIWERRRPLFEHLARTAHQFWLAEADGEPVGYARSIIREGVWELTEFFVLPQQQSAGVGRALLERVLPGDENVHHKVIIATADVRAQARYLKVGVYARFPITYVSRQAEVVSVPSELSMVPFDSVDDILDALREIDRQILGHGHDEDHRWLMSQRTGYLYLRSGLPAGYGYTGDFTGPFALLDESDFPAVLAHAESLAALRGEKFGVEVPLINQAAIDYLIHRGYKLDSFYAFFMSDKPFGHFDHYIFPSPPFFI